MNGISIIVCCYNSVLRLLPTLTHLAKQKTSLLFEVIVVDNASKDETSFEAQRIWDTFNSNITFKVVKEPQSGLCNARNKGVKEAIYDYIVFCDDDNWLDENYIQFAYDFLSNNPTYAAVGGLCEAVFEEDIIVPDWFVEFNDAYAVGIQGKEGDITHKRLLWGAGIAFRKSIYNQVININLPSLLSDRNGNELTSGGDNEICIRFIILGYKLYYTNNLKLKHFISSNRLTVDYRKKLLSGFESSNEIINKYMFYLNYDSGRIFYKLKLNIKYWLQFIRIRKMTIIDKKLTSLLNDYNTDLNDECFQLIKTLVRYKN